MIDLGFTTQYLYVSHQLHVVFELRDGRQKEGSGTAFFVLYGVELFAVTARHVLDPLYARPSDPAAKLKRTYTTGWNYEPSDGSMRPVAIELRDAPVFLDNEHDVAVIPVRESVSIGGVPVRPYIDHTLLAGSAEFDVDIRVGDFIAAPGYSAISAMETDRPVLLSGVISSDPRSPVTVKRPDGLNCSAVIYQSLSRAGLSGAPVFATQRGMTLGPGLLGPPHRDMRIAGINGGGFKDAATAPLQFSYFTRSDAILETLGKA